MDKVCIIVHYGGSWETKSNGDQTQPSGDVHYKGGRIKGLVISRNIGFNQLIDLLYTKLGFDRNKYSMALSARFVYADSKLSPIMSFENDDDVHFFVKHCSTTKKFTPLMVTAKEKVDRIDLPGAKKVYGNQKTLKNQVFDSVSSRNQINQLIRARSSSSFMNEDEATSPFCGEPREVNATLNNDISREKVWKVKELALNQQLGDPTESFSCLPRYCYMLEQSNLGTVTNILSDSENHFKCLFVMLNASKVGFLSAIRPVVSVDGILLNGKYRGTLFVASCKDANEQIFPLAFGVGDSENNESWKWFLNNLHEHIGHVRDLVFISDHNGIIEKAIQSVFPNALHGFCIRHISRHLKARYKFDDKLLDLYFTAAKLYHPSDFFEHFRKLEALSPEGTSYLQKIGFQKWARSHFPIKRFNILTMNVAEFNVFKNARPLPITAMVEYLRKTFHELFFKRRKVAASTTTNLSKWASVEIKARVQSSCTMQVTTMVNNRYLVSDGVKPAVVDMNGRSCSCRMFDLDKLPCPHALAVCSFRKVGDCQPSAWYSAAQWIRAYASCIFPIGRSSNGVIPEKVRMRIILPPMQRQPSGQRQMQ